MFPLIFNTIKDENDRTFMEEFYKQYRKLLYSQVRKLTKDKYEIEEIVQESLIHLIEKSSLIRTFSRDRLINYSISVVRYTAYGFFRKKKQFQLIPFEDCEFSCYGQSVLNRGLDELIIQRSEGEMLYYVWTHLKARDQALLSMKYILEYPNEKIAEVLGVAPESVRMMLTRAKRILSAKLSKAMVD